MGALYYLNDRTFTKAQLIDYSKEQLQKELATWEKDLFSFIIQWFNETTTIKTTTSGSTGQPKEIKLLKSNMKISAAKTIDFFELTKGQAALLCLPVQYIAGKMMVVRAFEAGMNLIAIKPESTPVMSQINAIDFAAMTPHQVRSLLTKELLLTKIKKIIIGGEAIGTELCNQIKEIPIEAYETYGMTETMSHVALRKITGNHPTPFKALPGVQFSTDDRNCLHIEADFLPEPVQTNDIVELISNTSFIFKGRNDFIINSGGIKLNPEKIEYDIKNTTGADVILSSVSDKKIGEKAILVFSSKQSDKQLKIIQELLASDTKTRLIKNYMIIENLPKTETGKTDRMALKQVLTERNAGAGKEIKSFE
jgi:O-succinylbenzoic acid--CoA ligase